MRWIFFYPAIFWGTLTGDLQLGLRSLQQLRNLIPERLSLTEFSIIVDRPAFEKMLEVETNFAMQFCEEPVLGAVGSSFLYYSRLLLSGEPIEILDSYQNFIYSSYWSYPTALQDLYQMYPVTTPHFE